MIDLFLGIILGVTFSGQILDFYQKVKVKILKLFKSDCDHDKAEKK